MHTQTYGVTHTRAYLLLAPQVCAHTNIHMGGEIVGLLLHHVHIDEEGVEPEMKHLVSPSKPGVKELNLDVPTERHWGGQSQLCVRICPLDVLVNLGRVDLGFVEPNDEARSYRTHKK